MNELYDVLIIGGGPGGLTAGMYCARAKLKVLLLERLMPGGQVILTGEIENYPGFVDAIAGPDLINLMIEQAERLGLEWESEDITGLKEKENYIELLADDKIYHSRVVILSTGSEPRKLNVPNEEEFRGRGVSYCAICDGGFFKNKEVAVIGGGDAAIEEALYLTKLVKKVYIIHRRDKLRATPILQKNAFDNPKIEFIWNTTVESINGEKKVENLTLKNKINDKISELNVSAIFIYVGTKPNTIFLKDTSLELDDIGYIITDNHFLTNIKGVYAVGDVRAGAVKQIVVAAGEGASAAIEAMKYLEGSEYVPRIGY